MLDKAPRLSHRHRVALVLMLVVAVIALPRHWRSRAERQDVTVVDQLPQSHAAFTPPLLIHRDRAGLRFDESGIGSKEAP